MKIDTISFEHELTEGKKIKFIIEGNDDTDIKIPQGVEEKTVINFTLNKKESSYPLSTLKNKPIEELNKAPFLKDIELMELDYSIPKIKITDITDKEILGFDTMGERDLDSSGLWIGNSIRRFEANIDSEFFDKASISDVEFNASFIWKNKNNSKIDIYQDCYKNLQNQFFINIDTNKIAEFFKKTDSKFTFKGIFIFEITYKSKQNYFERVEYPINVVFVNPEISDGWRKNSSVAIDFGTSSTCVAYKGVGGIRLMTFMTNPLTEADWKKTHEKHELYEDPYENPTAVNIFNWEKIYHSWQPKNEIAPHFLIGDGSSLDFGDFWQGYDTRNYLSDASSRFYRSAILNLKNIPNMIDKRGENPQINPYNRNGIEFINLIDSIDAENHENFNPISFYGYLIGKALNRQSKGELFTNYKLSTPVKFKKSVREKIRDSLKYGLSRALPLPIKDKISVDIDVEESVAFVGGVIGKEGFKIGRDGEPSPFAIFDFGGGTLDFAFGIYREIDENSDIETHCEKTIDVFAVDGYDNIGGEHLIDRLSYQIYRDNKDLMKENRIPFIIPDGEDKIEYFPDNLLPKSSVVANSNLKLLNEKFSRKFFMNIVEKVETSLDIEFMDIDDKPCKLPLTVVKDDLGDKLYKKLEESVISFRDILERTFTKNIDSLKMFGFNKDFDITDVKIFKGGNASKCWLLEEVFEKVFPEFSENENGAKILFINEQGERGVKPKNAVAKGIIEIEDRNIYVKRAYQREDGSQGIGFRVGSLNDENVFEEVLKKGDISSHWTKFRKVNVPKKKVDIYFTTTPGDIDKEHIDLNFSTIDLSKYVNILKESNFLYLKPKNVDEIEWCLGNKEAPNSNFSTEIHKLNS